MNNLCNKGTKSTDMETIKIKVTSAEIIVHGTVEKPYYEIKYYDMDNNCHIGYSSYDLCNVFEWLEKCFDIVHENEQLD